MCCSLWLHIEAGIPPLLSELPIHINHMARGEQHGNAMEGIPLSLEVVTDTGNKPEDFRMIIPPCGAWMQLTLSFPITALTMFEGDDLSEALGVPFFYGIIVIKNAPQNKTQFLGHFIYNCFHLIWILMIKDYYCFYFILSIWFTKFILDFLL